MAQDVEGIAGELLGGLLKGRKDKPAANAPGTIAVETVPSPDGNTLYQASGTALGVAATLTVAKNGDVMVAFDRDKNGSKETLVRATKGGITVDNTEDSRPAATVNNQALADALVAGGYEAIPTTNPKKIPKTVSQTDLDRSVAEAMVAAGEVPPPAAPAAAKPAAKPKGRS